MIRIIIFTGLLFVVSACKKDPIVIPNCTGCAPTTDCISQPHSQSVFGWQYEISDKYVRNVCINPNDGGEFSFVHQPHGNGQTFLYKYNDSNALLTLLYDGNLICRTQDWGNNGWLVLSLGDGNIYKLEDNGNNFTQLTFTGGDYGARWTTEGNIAFYRNEGVNKPLYVVYPDGLPLDTFYGLEFNHPFDFSQGQYAAVGGDDNIFLYDLQMRQATPIAAIPDPNYGGCNGIVFVDSQTVVWSHSFGLYKTNINTHQTQRILASCNSRQYLTPTFSALSNKILWIRQHLEGNAESNVMTVNPYVVIMNTDGTDERVIQLPL